MTQESERRVAGGQLTGRILHEDATADKFEIKDSGARKEYDSGMMRDTTEDKIEYWSMRIGPMYKRWASLLTKGRKKYPDAALGVPNWTLAAGEAELLHAKESFTRHTEAYIDGEEDEDHAAAIIFNINLMEYIKERMAEDLTTTESDFEKITGVTPRTFTDALKQEWAAVQKDAANERKPGEPYGERYCNDAGNLREQLRKQRTDLATWFPNT